MSTRVAAAIGQTIPVNLLTEGRAETGGEGSEANEAFADTTNGFRISGTEMDGREGQPNKLFEHFCFVGETNDAAVGREIGCTLRGGGCCAVVLAFEIMVPFPGRNLSVVPSSINRRSCEPSCPHNGTTLQRFAAFPCISGLTPGRQLEPSALHTATLYFPCYPTIVLSFWTGISLGTWTQLNGIESS
jgi:hypothetical protein